MSDRIRRPLREMRLALRCCDEGVCNACPYHNDGWDCLALLQQDVMTYVETLERMNKLMKPNKPLTKPSAHAAICAELTDLYTRKNADYGDSFAKSFDEYGFAMPCIRLDDKLNRLKSLTKGHSYRVDESVRDTLMDLANYAIMTVLELDMHAEDTDPGPRSIMVEAAPDA